MTDSLEEPLRLDDDEVNVTQPPEEPAAQEDNDVIFVPIPPQEPIIVEDDEDTPDDTDLNMGACSHDGVASSCARVRPITTCKTNTIESSAEEPTSTVYTGKLMNTVFFGPRIGWGSMLVRPKKNAETNIGTSTSVASNAGDTVWTTRLLCQNKSVFNVPAPPVKLIHENRAASNEAGNCAGPIAVENSAIFDATAGISAPFTTAGNSTATLPSRQQYGPGTTEPKINVGYAIPGACLAAGYNARSAITKPVINSAVNSAGTVVTGANAGSSITSGAFREAEKVLGFAKAGIITDSAITRTSSANAGTVTAAPTITSSQLNHSVSVEAGTSGTLNIASSLLRSATFKRPGENALTTLYFVPASKVQINMPKGNKK